MYEKYGFQAPRTCLARSSDEAALAAADIGFPVALKIASPDILHKTDIGGVALGLQSGDAVREAFAHIMTSVRAARPDARIEGVEVQEMVTNGTEVIIGLLNDPQFGPVIMFGLGGVFTEVLKDVVFRVLPIERADALQMIRETRGHELLRGYRGQKPVSEAMLVDLLMNAGRMGMDLAGKLESMDLNPILVWGDQHRVVDAKLIWCSEARPDPSPVAANTSHLTEFFKAGAVAVIGASATPGKVGNAVLASLVQGEYKGKVYPVNPGRREIMGLPAYPTMAAIPERVDLAVAAVDLAQMPALIRECAESGTHSLVIVSGGGKELGGEKRTLEEAIRRTARACDVRVVGPNCIGVFDGQTRLDTFFQVPERMVRPKPGSVAMITQSGTIGCAFLEHMADLGMSKFVSYGNRCDVDEGDLLTYLADDVETSVIAVYIEGLEDGRKFLAAARQAACKKPVVVFKGGRSERGARASMSHTGFFGGSYGLVRGAFAQAGLIAVDSYEELVAVCQALAMQPRATGRRVAMISNGAGTMVQAMDLFGGCNLEMPDLHPDSVRHLAAAYPPYYVVQNPIDVTGSGTSKDYAVGIAAFMNDPSIDIIMPWFVFQDTPLEETIVEELSRLSALRKKPILAGALGGPYTEKMSRAIEAVGVPVYHSVRTWVAAARGLAPNAQ
jgi:3-hydroxypropionyl-CoA synthetase (ADP-forming)